MKDITFADPQFFYLLLLVPLFIFWHWKRYRKQFTEMKMPTLAAFEKKTFSLRSKIRPVLLVFRILAFSLLVVALARPRSSSSIEKITSEGIDIVLATDISSSMLAEDLKPNRIKAAKNVAIDFIEDRPDDRIGLVVFSGESFTQCPLTIDHRVVVALLDGVKSGIIEDGTAIGMGLATSVSRLKDSKAKSKVVILLTDGVNNTGFIDPITAAEIAKKFHIRIYAIGVGTKGMAPYPVQTPFGIRYQNIEVQIDEDLLAKIAQMTDGKYFRATNNRKLSEIYKEIDKLEKTKLKVLTYQKYAEKFAGFSLLALILLFLEILLRYTLFRSFP